MGVTPARIGSAAAVLRRVVEGSIRRGADRALSRREDHRRSDLGHHLGPEEPGELTGDGGGHDRAHVLVGSQLSEAPGQTDLRGPGAGHGLWWHTLLALSDADSDVGAVLVGPGRFAELAPQMGIAGPGDRATALGETRRVLPGHEASEVRDRGRGAVSGRHLPRNCDDRRGSSRLAHGDHLEDEGAGVTPLGPCGRRAPRLSSVLGDGAPVTR